MTTESLTAVHGCSNNIHQPCSPTLGAVPAAVPYRTVPYRSSTRSGQLCVWEGTGCTTQPWLHGGGETAIEAAETPWRVGTADLGGRSWSLGSRWLGREAVGLGSRWWGLRLWAWGRGLRPGLWRLRPLT
eukprot:359079-Chlamydomonas_euryale.AAC.3